MSNEGRLVTVTVFPLPLLATQTCPDPLYTPCLHWVLLVFPLQSLDLLPGNI